MNVWEARFSCSDSTDGLVQLVSATSLRKAAIKAEKWLAEQKREAELISLSRRDDVVI
jgi:hypothetical protein